MKEAEKLAPAGAGCSGCAARDLRIAELQERLEQLDAFNKKCLSRVAELESLAAGYAQFREELERATRRIRQLEALLNRTSKNSHKPPSTEQPSRTKSKRPQKENGDGEKRKPGGQLGHEGKNRPLLPSDQVDKVIPHRPEQCGGCGSQLPPTIRPCDRIIERQQQWDLAEKPVVVTEHQAHAVECTSCGYVTRGILPGEVTCSDFGPGLTALGSFLAANLQASRRQVEEVFEDVLGVPIALGTVMNMESEVAESLQTPYEEAGAAVREADTKNIDETSWRIRNKLAWLWGAGTALVAFFVICPERGARGLQALLGGVMKGVFTSDRWKVYEARARRFRQICWSHLLRDFQQVIDRGGKGAGIGSEAKELAGYLFMVWRDFKEGGIDRATLQKTLTPIRRQLQMVLKRGVNLAADGVSTFCQNLLDLEPALWTFLRVEGVEPTNNHGERILRKGVLWRKRSFGSRGDGGILFAERMLTTVQTLRLQKRSAFHFLVDAVRAHRLGQHAPSLLPT